MKKNWQPTVIGKFFTGSQRWTLTIENERFALEFNNKRTVASVAELPEPVLVTGTFWSKVTFSPLPSSWGFEENLVVLSGIPHNSAKHLLLELSTANILIQAQAEKEQERQSQRNVEKKLPFRLESIRYWVADFKQSCKKMYQTKGWLSKEFIQKQKASKPLLSPSKHNDQAISSFLEKVADDIALDIRLWQQDLDAFSAKYNERFFDKATKDLATSSYFRSIEKSPLNYEQTRAVVCNDSRVLLIAAAGSGKTSTIIAKLGYVLQKQYFKPSKVLLLAFNRSAAVELKERTQLRLSGIDNIEDVSIKTFHALSLGIIGEATGKKPSVADWVDSGKDLRTIEFIVQGLKKKSSSFRRNWDLFRVVFSNEVAGARTDEDLWEVDKSESQKRYWTSNGEHVRSRGELALANWLHYHGVNYKYEQDYFIDTADSHHRQYKPDFYFPDIDTYLELWALNSRGNPPSEFKGYREGMDWKRQVHFINDTKLLEVTSAGIFSGRAFSFLEKELKQAGVILAFDPDRPVKGRQPIKNARLVKVFRTFLSHAKGNRLTTQELRQRINSGVAGGFKYRSRIFLGLFEKIWREWDSMLTQENSVDFDDLLGSACDCLEKGEWTSPYDLIMVDEFQDASFARARLISELLKEEDKYLFAVGDDWQGINRFAGADSSVMREFEVLFGKGETLALQQTYRCSQSLCNITSQFVTKNPLQLKKEVVSKQPDVVEPVLVYRVSTREKINSAVQIRIEEIIASSNKPTNILILGRYNRDKRFMPKPTGHFNAIISFKTVHSSKGLEADHVILPNVLDATLGFPSKVEDDPVMQLAMLDAELFPFAEERRLFYVALTRARETVTLVTPIGQESLFLQELVSENGIKIQNFDCESVETCSVKGCTGHMVERVSKYGEFMGCSRYPACKNKY